MQWRSSRLLPEPCPRHRQQEEFVARPEQVSFFLVRKPHSIFVENQLFVETYVGGGLRWGWSFDWRLLIVLRLT